MQEWIKPEEKATLMAVTEGHGRVAWFIEKSGISANTLVKLRTRGVADEKKVEQMRAALKDPEVRELIKTLKQNAATA